MDELTIMSSVTVGFSSLGGVSKKKNAKNKIFINLRLIAGAICWASQVIRLESGVLPVLLYHWRNLGV